MPEFDGHQVAERGLCPHQENVGLSPLQNLVLVADEAMGSTDTFRSREIEVDSGCCTWSYPAAGLDDDQVDVTGGGGVVGQVYRQRL